MKVRPVIIAWIASKLIFILVAGAAVVLFHFNADEVLFRWDAVWYLKIAELGYFSKNSLVFPPLYPLAADLVNVVLNNYRLSLMVVSNGASLVAAIFVFKLLSKWFSPQNSLSAIWLMLCSPIGFVFSLPYSESLFWALSVIFFYLLTEKKYGWAALTINGLFLTRVIGLLHYLPLLILIRKEKMSLVKKLLILLSGLPGLLIWLLFNFWQFGHPLIWLMERRDYFYGLSVFPVTLVYQIIYLVAISPKWQLNSGGMTNWLLSTFPYWLDMGLVGGLVWLMVKNLKQLPKIFLYYVVVYVFIVTGYARYSAERLLTIPPPALGFTRYLMVCFPIFVLVVRKIKNLDKVIWASIFLQAIYLSYYVFGLYVP